MLEGTRDLDNGPLDFTVDRKHLAGVGDIGRRVDFLLCDDIEIDALEFAVVLDQRPAILVLLDHILEQTDILEGGLADIHMR